MKTFKGKVWNKTLKLRTLFRDPASSLKIKRRSISPEESKLIPERSPIYSKTGAANSVNFRPSQI